MQVHEAGDADPTPDPCGRRLVLQPGKPIGPDRDLDDIAAPRAKIDKDIALVRTLALFPGSRLDFDDPPDQLDPVADPLQRSRKIERIDDRIGGDVGRRRLCRGRGRWVDRCLRRRNIPAGEKFVQGWDRREGCFADCRKAARLRLQLRHRQQTSEDFAVLWVSEVVGLEDDGLAALTELRVQRSVLNEGPQAAIKRNEAESVHPWTEIGATPSGMLEVPVPGLAAVAGMHTGDEHAIVIDQLDVAICHHYIAVLNVTVRDSLPLEKTRNSGKIGTSLLQRARIVEILVQPDTRGSPPAQIIPPDPKNFSPDAI